jgi:ubiquitin C-terminal hydrolase
MTLKLNIRHNYIDSGMKKEINGGHFICTLKFGNMWYMYDGLKVYNNRSASECLKPQYTPSPINLIAL